MLPDPQDNPHGLHKRYIVQKTNGDPVDPEAIYFVLRLDGAGDDMDHVIACRAAARAYVERIERLRTPHLQRMAQELKQLIDTLDGITCRRGELLGDLEDDATRKGTSLSDKTQFEVIPVPPVPGNSDAKLILSFPWANKDFDRDRPHLAVWLTPDDARAVAADLIAHADKIEGK